MFENQSWEKQFEKATINCQCQEYIGPFTTFERRFPLKNFKIKNICLNLIHINTS